MIGGKENDKLFKRARIRERLQMKRDMLVIEDLKTLLNDAKFAEHGVVWIQCRDGVAVAVKYAFVDEEGELMLTVQEP